jgi:hypothetical protein
MQLLAPFLFYSDDQPRGEDGKWTDGAGTAVLSAAEKGGLLTRAHVGDVAAKMALDAHKKGMHGVARKLAGLGAVPNATIIATKIEGGTSFRGKTEESPHNKTERLSREVKALAGTGQPDKYWDKLGELKAHAASQPVSEHDTHAAIAEKHAGINAASSVRSAMTEKSDAERSKHESGEGHQTHAEREKHKSDVANAVEKAGGRAEFDRKVSEQSKRDAEQDKEQKRLENSHESSFNPSKTPNPAPKTSSLPSGVSASYITYDNAKPEISVKAPYNPSFIADAKSLGAKWSPSQKTWSFPHHEGTREEHTEKIMSVVRKHYK